MRDADLPAVHRLEVVSQPVPWPLWFFRRQLRSSASCWVLEADEAIIGFGIVAFEDGSGVGPCHPIDVDSKILGFHPLHCLGRSFSGSE